MSTAQTDPTAGDSSGEAGQKPPGWWKTKALPNVQKFGRSLMLPIASLPAARTADAPGSGRSAGGRRPRLGRVAVVVGAAGSALFDWLPLIFAVGVAIGMAKKADGSTALAAVIGYVVYMEVTEVMSPSSSARRPWQRGTSWTSMSWAA